MALLALAMAVHLGAADRPDGAAANRPLLFGDSLTPIEGIVREEVARGRIPGAVVLIGQGDTTLYRRAFGLRVTGPVPVPMTEHTIFDLASLTKVVATTTAVLQLAERGQLSIDSPASAYWPAFARAGKGAITIRDLLTHYSGLKAGVTPASGWSGYPAAMRLIAGDRPVHTPGTQYLYSDQNFLVLGEVVRRVSGLPLDEYCERNIFAPLGMRTTQFRLSPALIDRVAPTGPVGRGRRRGIVNDPTALRVGGVAGHAGLFSTADDLEIFVRMLLAGGEVGDVDILSRQSIEQMIAPQSPSSGARLRGFGWDLAAPLASNRHELSPVGSFGHTGYTGTMIWVDPASRAYVIVLTNRMHPDGRGDVQPLRDRILGLLSVSLGSLPTAPAISTSTRAGSCQAAVYDTERATSCGNLLSSHASNSTTTALAEPDHAHTSAPESWSDSTVTNSSSRIC